jgi:uncharacterized protein YeaO (DUF488 family)
MKTLRPRFAWQHKKMAAAPATSDVPKLTELNPLPEFINHRQTIWDTVKTRYSAELEAKTPEAIIIKTFGKVTFQTNHYLISKSI